VTPVNDAPVVSTPAAITSQPGTTVSLNPLAGATDVDSDAAGLTASLTSPPAHGSITVAVDGTWHYTPDVTYAGEDSFTFVVSDGTAASAPVTYRFTVTPGKHRAGSSPWKRGAAR
jgi:large repetitive protein